MRSESLITLKAMAKSQLSRLQLHAQITKSLSPAAEIPTITLSGQAALACMVTHSNIDDT